MITTDLDRALVDIRRIRRQVAESTEFRGYGPVSLFTAALVAMAGGVVQARWVTEPGAHPWLFAGLWLSVAVFCAALIASEMLLRARRFHTGMSDEMVRIAVVQFLPAGVAGAVLPFALLHAAPGAVWMLPGLWQLIFGLGVFACCRSLPRPMLLVGAWFLLAAFACVVAGDRWALSPLSMSGAFGAGMAMVAVIHARNAHTEGVEDGEDD